MAHKDQQDKMPEGMEIPPEHARMGDAEMRDIHAQLMREKEEPTEGFRPVPMFLIFLFAGLMGWGGYYMGEYNAGFDPMNFREDLQPGTTAEDTGPAAPVDPIAQGRRIYSQQCSVCHQGSGEGVPGSFPPLADSRWVQGKPERVIKILLAGLNGPIEVKGNIYNGEMPAFGQLRDSDIASVLTFVRQEWGNDAPAITEEMIASVREEYGDRSQPWTAPELLELHPWSQDSEAPEPAEEDAPAEETPAEPAA